MSARLDDALEICLEALRTGADLESCLALYPEIANELRPNLETAIALGSTAFAVPPDAYHRSRTRVLQRLSKL
ncbi:MAG: hypothetical protein GTO14_09635, partial [Anaerolineales bacterium]|nr:hypothetical protein [Anaerolineales bacterium]